MGTESISLKWGTLKGWDVKPDSPAFVAIMRYHEFPVSMSCAMQHDTPEQKQAICEAIDALDAESIYLDWDDKDVSKEEAKQYVMTYGSK